MKPNLPMVVAYLGVWATFVVPLGGLSLWLADRERDHVVRLERSIASVETGLTARIDGVENRQVEWSADFEGKQEERLAALESRLTAQINDVEARQKERLAALEASLRAEIRQLADQVAVATSRLNGVAGRVNELAADTANIKGFLAAVQAVQREAEQNAGTAQPKENR